MYRPSAPSPGPKPRQRRRQPPAAPRSRASATREGGIGTQPSPRAHAGGGGLAPVKTQLTPAQRRIAQQLVAGYKRSSSGSVDTGKLGSELDSLGHAYTHNPVYRAPIIGHKGLLGGLEDVVKSSDPIALEQAAARNLSHPLAGTRFSSKASQRAAGLNYSIIGKFGRTEPGGFIERPRTQAEAEQRLAHLEKQQEEFHQALTGQYKTVDPDYQRYLNKTEGLRKKSAKGEKKAGTAKANRAGNLPQGTAAEQFTQRLIDEAVAKHPEHPAVKAYLANVKEASDLRQALSAQHMPGEEPLPADYGTIRVPAPKRAVAKAEKQSGPLVEPKAAELPSNLPGLELSPEEAQKIVSKSLGSFRGQYAAKKAARSEELGRRVAKAQSAQEAAGGGIEGVKAAKRQLKGELTPGMFLKLRKGELSQQDLEGLVKHLQNHPSPELDWFDKNIIGPDALTSAFRDNRIPSPHEIEVLRKAFGEEAANVMAHKSFAKKVGENALGLWNLPRALVASIDVSFPGRQGIGVLAANPKIWAKAWGPQMKALPARYGERFYHEELARLHEDPNFRLSQDAGVKYTELGRGGAQREEPFVSKFSEKLPGVRASARAYTLYGDEVRLKLFNYYLEKARREGVNVENMRELNSIAKLVNTFSGRGGGKRLAQASPVANAFFFAPQLIASRVNMLNPVWGRTLTPFARRQLLIARARLGLGAGAALTGASLAGASVATDPRNADFAKIRVGNTRFDLLAGLQQYPRALSQIEQGKIVSSTTGRTLKLGPGFGQLSRWDIIERFGASKLNPSASLVYDKLRGRDFLGNKFSWPQAIKQRSIPLSLQDTADLFREGKASPGNIAKTAGGYAITASGVGEQTYGDTAKKKAQKKLNAAKKQQDVHLDNLVRKGILPKQHRAKMREALDVYDERNMLNTTIENATQNSSGSTDKPLLREQRKMDALLTLLGQHKMMKPADVAKAKRYYRTTKLTPKEISRQREWVWRNHGPGAWITWYRDKAGASD